MLHGEFNFLIFTQGIQNFASAVSGVVYMTSDMHFPGYSTQYVEPVRESSVWMMQSFMIWIEAKFLQSIGPTAFHMPYLDLHHTLIDL